jgi:hypothetical protein
MSEPGMPGKSESAKSGRFSILVSALRILSAIIVIVILAALVLTPDFERASSSSPYMTCKNNLKELGLALECFYADNAGHYPESLAVLVPRYIKAIPGCPAARTFKGRHISKSTAQRLPREWVSCMDTYSKSYRVAHNPEVYTIVCKGNFHGEVTYPDFPQYDSVTGLMESLRDSRGSFKEGK